MIKSSLFYGTFLVILVSFLSGCVTVGHPIPEQAALKITIGKTTRADIEQELGTPYRTGIDSGDQTASYLYYKLGLFTKPITSDLNIVFTDDNIVKSYTFNTNQPSATDKTDE